MEQLVDIKPFVTVDDSSLYIFIALCLAAALLLIFAILKLVSFYKNRKPSPREKAYKNLSSIDFKNAKSSAYTISKNAFILAQSELQKEYLQELNEALEKYKYQKNVPDFKQEDKQKLKTFMELCDV